MAARESTWASDGSWTPETVLEVAAARTPWCPREVLRSTLTLADEITRENIGGRCPGALFTIGRTDRVLPRARPLILDPLQGHAPAETHVSNAALRGTVKKLAQLDGAFIIADDGTVVAACRYLDVPCEGVRIPMGLGSRHLVAASASKHLGIVAVVVSQSGRVRVFCEGDLVA